MLDRLAPQTRGSWRVVQPRLNHLQNGLVFPTTDAPVRSGCALWLEMAAATRRRPILVQRLAVLDGGEPIDGSLPRGTWVLVAPAVVDEVALVEAALELAGRGQRLR